MKMKHLLLGFCLFGTLISNAQVNFCGADELLIRHREEYPEMLQTEAALEAFTKWFIENKNNLSRDEEQHYIVPVVFHILHDGGVEYVSDERIYREMVSLNEFWSATNTQPNELGENFSNVPEVFRNIVADMNIEFRLARKDPQGNCTNGINRIYTYATNFGSDDVKITSWPRDKYLNIWSIATYPSSGAQAYAYYPSDGLVLNNHAVDGLITHQESIGRTQYGDYLRPVLAHEAGHWLNLAHTWGSGDQGNCNGTDNVDDTPPSSGGNPSSCNKNANTCHNDVEASNGYYTEDVIDNVQNCMNYAGCHYMFTEGQKARARAALESETGQRRSLWQPENLTATGVEPLSDCLPAPRAEFGYNKRYACVGENIRVVDFTGNTNEWTREWEFPVDVEGASGNDSIQLISFSAPGWKTITLKSANASGTSAKTKTAIYIRDNTTPPIPYPFYESFNDPVSAADWIPVNYDNNVTEFTYRNDVGHNSNGSFGLNHYQATYRGDRDELISPAFDLTGISEADFRFTFDFSFACRFDHEMTNSNYDSIASLEAYISNNCGATWKRVSRIIGNRQLMNGGFINASYVPGHENQYWKKVTVNLAGGANNAYKTSGVQFKFVVSSTKNGNNFYFDNFNLANSEAGIDETEDVANLQLFPNPTANNATLLIDPLKGGNYKVEVLNLLGENIMTAFDAKIAGQTEVNINTSSLAKGVYLVQVSSNGKTQQQKLVKM